MQYPNICRAQFVARPNRFVARVLRDGTEETVHVKNTGRCRELLVPGATVYLAEGDNPNRKTRYDLVAVEKGPLLVNLDSQAPNKVFAEWARAGNFRPGLTLLRPETVWGNSRFDFYWEAADGRKGFVEVKGVTLEENGHARFPDAPTLRGVKHLEELALCRGKVTKRRSALCCRWRAWWILPPTMPPTRPLARRCAGPPPRGYRCWRWNVPSHRTAWPCAARYR